MRRRRVDVAQLPRWLRPKLASDQVRDLGLVHMSNLDAIARGEGTEELLWQVVGGLLTWSQVAEKLGRGVDEMNEQLQLVTRLVERYGRTGRVVFDGPDYQLAKRGVDVMDALAEIVDRPTAVEAADWSEARVNRMAAGCADACATPVAA